MSTSTSTSEEFIDYFVSTKDNIYLFTQKHIHLQTLLKEHPVDRMVKITELSRFNLMHTRCNDCNNIGRLPVLMRNTSICFECYSSYYSLLEYIILKIIFPEYYQL
jgi:hypothetical protein